MSSAIILTSNALDFAIPGTLVASTSAPPLSITIREAPRQNNGSGRQSQVGAGAAGEGAGQFAA
jgi:hypothetical protein